MVEVGQGQGQEFKDGGIGVMFFGETDSAHLALLVAGSAALPVSPGSSVVEYHNA